MNNTTLLHGECFELMKDIASNSVDMILTDPQSNAIFSRK